MRVWDESYARFGDITIRKSSPGPNLNNIFKKKFVIGLAVLIKMIKLETKKEIFS